jgi:hypothetical protein
MLAVGVALVLQTPLAVAVVEREQTVVLLAVLLVETVLLALALVQAAGVQ